MSMPPFTIDAKARARPVMSLANRPEKSSARPGRSSLSARFGGHDPAYRGQEGEGIPPPPGEPAVLCFRCVKEEQATRGLPTRIELRPDGTWVIVTSGDALYAAAMLDDDDAPELKEEQFQDLTKAIRDADRAEG